MARLFFPPPQYVPTLQTKTSVTLKTLCDWADIPCRASGAWTERPISWDRGHALAIVAEPGPIGAVHVVLPGQKDVSLQTVARELLVILAYGLFDGVARESVRGVSWARQLAPRGRPRQMRAKSAAERQRAWRDRQGQAVF